MACEEDPFREVRTMILLSLPYPPLPVPASRVVSDEGVLGEETLTTTHTLIARCLNAAACRNAPKENEERRRKQQEVFQCFLHAMGTKGFFENAEGVYRIYCEFSRQHIATYFPPGHPLDLAIHQLDKVCKGDQVHSKMAEYMAAQSIFYEDNPRVSREEYLARDYRELIMMLRHRLGYALTEEEKRALESQDTQLD